jgi:UPF0176 protein
MERFLNIAAYKFVSLDQLPERRRALKAACDAAELRGTILLSHEGINLFIAGLEEPLRRFLATLTTDPALHGLEVKESWSDYQPFNRMLVRLKREIISMGMDEIQPARRTSPKLAATELKRWLDEGREVTLLDVRNDYEIGVGTFVGAKAIGVDHFRHFPAAVKSLPDELKEKPIVMFCTGGIRCEKAGPFMEQEGFEQIYQLDGGILKYFEECGGAHYEGDCFVFDKRVALAPDLKESGLGMCFVCQAILSPEDQASPLYVVEKSCPHCYQETSTHSRILAQRNDAIQEVCDPLPGSVPYDNIRPIRIPERLERTRLFDVVADLFPHCSREYWQHEFDAGLIKLGDRVVDGETIARAGQRYSHLFPATVEPAVSAAIEMIYEDDALVVVSKPAPLPMHPSGRFNRNTLVSILRKALDQPTLRPVHRLDANTTGVAIFAKTKAIAGDIQRQFDAGRVQKTYLANCLGVPEEVNFQCDAPITRSRMASGGRGIGQALVEPNLDDRPFDALEQADDDASLAADESADGDLPLDALTKFIRLQALADGTALLQAHPITGRTNQIRVHLWHLGFPIVGDPMYLPRGERAATQTLDLPEAVAAPMRLHAWKVTLRHPRTGMPLVLVAPEPSWVPQGSISAGP